MQVGTAARTTSLARCQSIERRKANERLRLVSVAEIAMIGTTGSGPTIGTSTSGINAPVPYPVTPLSSEVNAATAAISRSCGIEISSNRDRGEPYLWYASSPSPNRNRLLPISIAFHEVAETHACAVSAGEQFGGGALRVSPESALLSEPVSHKLSHRRAPRRIVRDTIEGDLIQGEPRYDPGFFGGAQRHAERRPPRDTARNQVVGFERKAWRRPARRQRDERTPRRIGGALRRPRPGDEHTIDVTVRPQPIQEFPRARLAKRRRHTPPAVRDGSKALIFGIEQAQLLLQPLGILVDEYAKRAQPAHRIRRDHRCFLDLDHIGEAREQRQAAQQQLGETSLRHHDQRRDRVRRDQ